MNSSVRAPRSTKISWIIIAIAVAVLLLDQISKIVMLNVLDATGAIPLLGDFLQLKLVRNPGAAFSFGTGFTWVFTLFSAAVSVAIIWYIRKVTSLPVAIGLGLVLGGSLGNLTDRFFREPGFPVGHVIDFIYVRGFAIFNIADSGIVCGAIVVVVAILWQDMRQQKLPEQDSAKEAPTDGR